MTLGEILKEYRKSQDISQRRLAQKVNLSNNYISILESGVNPKTGMPVVPSIDVLKAFADVMGIGIDDLVAKMDDDSSVSVNADDERKMYERKVTRQLRDNPKLRLLFDKTSKMSDKDMDAVLGVVNAILRETDDN